MVFQIDTYFFLKKKKKKEKKATTDWISEPAGEFNASVAEGNTVIVPFNEGVPQAPPVVETVYAKGDPVTVVGVPEMVTLLPVTAKVTPAGKPDTVAPVTVPPNVYTMLVIGLCTQRVWLAVAAEEVQTNEAKG